MSVFRLLVRVSQHLWRQVPLSTLPGGESLTSVFSCYAAIPNIYFRVDFDRGSQLRYWTIGMIVAIRDKLPVKLNQI